MEMGNIYNSKVLIQKLFSLIGLATPASRIAVFTSGILLLSLLPTKDLPYLPVRSIFETVFHIKPYSSGMTRAVSLLLHGNFVNAWKMNVLVYPVIGVVAFLLAKDIVNLIKNNYIFRSSRAL